MTQPSLPESLAILGTPVTVLNSYDHATDLVRERVASRLPTLCLAVNPAKIYLARRDPILRRVLDTAQLRICDGTGVAVAALLLHGRRLRRCTGIELMLRLVGLSARERWRVFLLGASPESNAGARARLLETYPGLRIVGNRDGYFKDSAEVVAAVNASGADLLFVAMGSPRQEMWIAEHLPRLNVSFCMGVGGSFDVISGLVRWAPAICRKTGTEWLYRVLMQPSRIPRLWTNGLFALNVLAAAVAGRTREFVTPP
jgi:N-acetylglucosaminyldiphosphoundecaprenol N-acetyl-beta-D-mannosaminyltransferase